MDIVQLKELIIENADNYITTILENLSCNNIHNYAKEFRCSDNRHSSSNGIRVSKETLYTKSYYDNFEGDLISLVQFIKSCTFKQAISCICQWLGIEESVTRQQVQLPFDGYYKSIKAEKKQGEPLRTYEKSVLDEYLNISNHRFLKDGISLKTQSKYGIGYDLISDRITIPWYNSEDELVGVIGRINASTQYIKDNNIAKYFPIISFPKSKVLYGLNYNYNSILKQKIILVTEGEKGCMQLDSMGLELGVSIGCHSVSDEQVKLIHSMFPEQIIVAFDEGVTKEELELTCGKLLYNSGFYKCRVGYIFDEFNKYLPKESKASPTDKGMEVFKSLLNECLFWISERGN